MEIKNRKSYRFNSTVETPWYALSDFYRTAILSKRRKGGEQDYSPTPPPIHLEVIDLCVWTLQEVVADVVAVVLALVECLRGGAIACRLSLLDGSASCRDGEDAPSIGHHMSLLVKGCA